MGASCAAGVSRGTVLVLAGLSLAACASVGPRYPVARGSGDDPDGSLRGPYASAPGRGTNKPYEINGRWYYPSAQPGYDEIGLASWYGEQFHNHATADGEVFDMNLPSAAHKTLPLPSMVEVTNLANGRKIVVRVNDRGPFVDGRIIDLSKEAARELGFYGRGVTQVRVRYVGQAPDLPRVYQASVSPPASQKPASVRARPEPQTQMASMSPVLGAEIEDRPLQDSPSTMTWTSAPSSPAPVQTASIASPDLPIEAAEAAAAVPAPSSDIDTLLSGLASGTPAAPAASPAAVQAGAFASRANAERAATAYGPQARVVPAQLGGRVLYKVMVAQ